MKEEEILQELNDHLPYDYCRSEGTEDGTYQEWIDEDSWQFQLKLLVENKNEEIERLHTIIKEARQCIEENYPTSTINYQDDRYKLLEILDKVEEDK